MVFYPLNSFLFCLGDVNGMWRFLLGLIENVCIPDGFFFVSNFMNQHIITSNRTLEYSKQIGGLTRQIPRKARLLTEETLPGSPGLALEVEGFAFQVPEAWAGGNKSSGFQQKTLRTSDKFYRLPDEDNENLPGGFEGWNGPWCAIVGTDTITNTRQ